MAKKKNVEQGVKVPAVGRYRFVDPTGNMYVYFHSVQKFIFELKSIDGHFHDDSWLCLDNFQLQNLIARFHEMCYFVVPQQKIE